jgi:hypothetical protein
MLMKNPVIHTVSSLAREITTLVYSEVKGLLSTEVLRNRVDPYGTIGAGRKDALLEAVHAGLLYVGKQNGVIVVCAPWVDGVEITSAHLSVAPTDGLLAPVARRKAAVGRSAPKAKGIPPEAVEAAWQAYLRVTGRKVRPNKERMRACKELASNYPLADIEQAFTGLMKSTWHQGENEQGIKYLEPHLVMRSFEMFYTLGQREGHDEQA